MEQLKRKTLGKVSFDLKRLTFLVDFLNIVGCKSLQEAGDKAGLTRQMMLYSFNRDDINISHIYRIIESYGYELKMEYINPHEENNTPKEDNSIEFNIERDEDDMKKRLSCLKNAIYKYNISFYKMEKVMHISRQTISIRFRKDDSLFSMLSDFAEKFNLKLKIDIRKKPVDKQLILEKDTCENLKNED